MLARIVKQLKGAPAIPAVGGLVLAGIGWTFLGLIALVGGVAWAWSRSNSTGALLDDALVGSSIALDEQLLKDLRDLPGVLSKARMQGGVEQIAMQAHEQLATLVKGFQAFKTVLRQRFDPAEMTHGRYLRAGEQVFLSALDDLNRTGTQLQALATMDHPSIAKVYDAGTSKSGRPYFVMELVQGLPITEFCDRNKLSTDERLQLMIPVCQAIQSA